jgi:hypothetical protein
MTVIFPYCQTHFVEPELNSLWYVLLHYPAENTQHNSFFIPLVVHRTLLQFSSHTIIKGVSVGNVYSSF